ncbi:MAG: arginase family protein [Pseudobdellovibrio sp.]
MIKNLFSFIEAPVYQGQKHFGVSLGPGFIRQCLLDQKYNFKSLAVQESQNQSDPQFEIYEELSYLVEREVRRNQLTFIAGGDHSLSIGSLQGVLRAEPDVKVLWVDAHGDVNTRKSSMTGSYHGMPLAFLLGEDRLQGQDWFSEYLKPENLIYYGVRDLDKAEKDFLDKKKIVYYTSQDVQKDSNKVIKEISQKFCNSKLHLSVDSDAFDPLLAPSTGVPVLNGMNYNHVQNLISELADKNNILSYEYVELNPQIFSKAEDVFGTAQIGINLFSEILKKQQKKESFHGSNDRFSYSEKSDLLHSSF